jgi:hypothetical protein
MCSRPVPQAVGTCSGGLPVPGEDPRGDAVPASGVAMDGGQDHAAGTSVGGVPGVPTTAGPRSGALVAPASQPLALGQPLDGFMPFLCVPLSICTGGLAG